MWGDCPGVDHICFLLELFRRKENLDSRLRGLPWLGSPCTPFHGKHAHFCLFCFACPLNTLPMFGEFTTLPDLGLLHKPHSFFSSAFFMSRNYCWCGQLKNEKCFTCRREGFGGGGWWGEARIAESDLSKYLESLESRHMKEGCGLRAETEGGRGAGDVGEKKQDSQTGGGNYSKHSPKRLHSIQFF